MTERGTSDAGKSFQPFGQTAPHVSQRWPDGAPWPDSSEHRHAILPALPLPPADPRPFEHPARGTAYALAAVPAAVALWLILGRLGWMASVLAFLTAVGAARLYLAGSRGGAMTRRGAAAVVTAAATVLLTFLAAALLEPSATVPGDILPAALSGALGCLIMLRPLFRRSAPL